MYKNITTISGNPSTDTVISTIMKNFETGQKAIERSCALHTFTYFRDLLRYISFTEELKPGSGKPIILVDLL